MSVLDRWNFPPQLLFTLKIDSQKIIRALGPLGKVHVSVCINVRVCVLCVHTCVRECLVGCVCE